MKILAVIPMAIFEVLFLGVCWVVAFIHKPIGRKLIKWSMQNLPSKEWYYK